MTLISFSFKEFLNLGTIDILGLIILGWERGCCPVHYRVFGSISGFYSLDAIALPRWQAKMFPDIDNGPPEGKIDSRWDLQCDVSKSPIFICGLFQGRHLPHLSTLRGPWTCHQKLSSAPSSGLGRVCGTQHILNNRNTQYSLWPQIAHWLDSVFSKCGLETACIKTIMGALKVMHWPHPTPICSYCDSEALNFIYLNLFGVSFNKYNWSCTMSQALGWLTHGGDRKDRPLFG